MISLFLTNHIQWHFTENGFAIKLFFTWLLNSIYAAHELKFSTFVWHGWCCNILTYLAYFTVGPRNHMAGALENWYWSLTTGSCRPSTICVRGWRNNDVAVKHCSVDMTLNSWKDPWKKITHKYVDLLRFPVRPRSRSELGICDLHYLGRGGRGVGFASQGFVWGGCFCCNEPISGLKRETRRLPKWKLSNIEYIYFWKLN